MYMTEFVIGNVFTVFSLAQQEVKEGAMAYNRIDSNNFLGKSLSVFFFGFFTLLLIKIKLVLK